MKAILTILFFSFYLSTSIYAQKVGQMKLENLDIEYIHITGTITSFNSITVKLDYGQEIFAPKEQRIIDSNGSPIKFNSAIAALNFMHQFGYEYVDNNSSGDAGSSFRYLLRKKRN